MPAKARKTLVLPAHVVAIALVPLVTEAYDKIRPRFVEWAAERQYRRMHRDWELFLRMTGEEKFNRYLR